MLRLFFEGKAMASSTFTLDRLLALCFMIFLLAGGELRAFSELIFVESGAPKAVIEIGTPWKRDAGFLELQGTGSVLYADAVIDQGDFVIEAVIQIDELSNSAATFCFEA
ncbi:MAG: hypothetical protein VXX31_15810, partial [Planctomycetota bacterium]|nr:hypothetical protein [Planctomycetota bacterium]